MQCNLFDAINDPAKHVFGIFEEDTIIGLFVFLILANEDYMEMLVGLSKEEKAYDEIFSYLKSEYKGYNIDFVYNPNNYLLHRVLQDEKAEFEVEQQKMVLKNEITYNSNHHLISHAR